MKKLFIMAFVAQVSLVHGEHKPENLLDRLPAHSKVKQNCAQVSPAWYVKGDLETHCDVLADAFNEAKIRNEMFEHFNWVVQNIEYPIVINMVTQGKAIPEDYLKNALTYRSKTFLRRALKKDAKKVTKACTEILVNEGDEVQKEEFELIQVTVKQIIDEYATN